MNSVRRPLTYVLLVVVGVVVGIVSYRLLASYHASRVLDETLPDLPPIRSEAPEVAVQFDDKVWVHRANSVERAVLMAKDYKGLEIDVVYDSTGRYFDVGHPPEPSAGISLEHVLLAIPDVSSHFFWLDFKNLSEANTTESCEVLVSLARRFNIIRNTIVESPNPKALSCLTEAGFYTSYYLFAELDFDDVRVMSGEQLTQYYKEVQTNLLGATVNAVSADYRYLPFIEKYVPDRDILLWYLEDKRTLSYHFLLGHLRLNARIKVILISHPGPGYR